MHLLLNRLVYRNIPIQSLLASQALASQALASSQSHRSITNCFTASQHKKNKLPKMHIELALKDLTWSLIMHEGRPKDLFKHAPETTFRAITPNPFIKKFYFCHKIFFPDVVITVFAIRRAEFARFLTNIRHRKDIPKRRTMNIL